MILSEKLNQTLDKFNQKIGPVMDHCIGKSFVEAYHQLHSKNSDELDFENYLKEHRNDMLRDVYSGLRLNAYGIVLTLASKTHVFDKVGLNDQIPIFANIFHYSSIAVGVSLLYSGISYIHHKNKTKSKNNKIINQTLTNE